MSDQLKVYIPEELTYSAAARCQCGAGLAYVNGMQDGPEFKNWNCSKILTQPIKIRLKEEGSMFNAGILQEEGGILHDGPRPFITFEIKSEHQPSAEGATTRP